MCAELEFRHAGRCAIRQGKAFGVSLANQGTAGLDLVRSQGDIGGVLEHDLLPLAAQNEAKKLIERRIERLAGRLVGVEEREAAQRIGGECNVLVSRRLRKPTGFFDHGNNLHARIDVGDARVADSVTISGYLLCHGEDDLFESDVLPPLATLVADAEDPLAHEFLEAVPGFDAVELDRLVRPLADQPEISPLRNRLAAATMRARVHRVELIEDDLLERIVLVHVERDRVQSTKVPVGASGYWDAQRVVAELAPEFLDVVGFELARHEDEIEVALDELDGAETSGVRRRDREGYFRMVNLEFLEPPFDECFQHVGRSTLEISRYFFLARLEGGQGGVEDWLENFWRRQFAAGALPFFRFLRCLRHVALRRRDDAFDQRPGIGRLRRGGGGNDNCAGR